MNLRTMILGAHCSFIREGTSDTAEEPAVPVSASHRPDLADSALYKSIGTVESATITPTLNRINLRSPQLGGYKLRKSIVSSQDLTITMRMQDYSPLTIEALFLTATPVVVGTPVKPMAQPAVIRGWMKLLLYDQTNQKTIEVFLYGEMTLSQVAVAEGQYAYDWSFSVLESTLNSMTLSSLIADLV